MNNKPKLLLHACCAICAAALAESLRDKFQLALFFYNPNIHPEEEYLKRKDSVISLAKEYNLEFFEGEYEPDKWFLKVRGLEEEFEGRERCPVCFRMRLLKTARFAEKINAPLFSTTLIQSHLKNEDVINKIGEEISEEIGIKYLNFNDFKIDKKDSLKRAKEIAREKDFYRQKYCGCIFSKF